MQDKMLRPFLDSKKEKVRISGFRIEDQLFDFGEHLNKNSFQESLTKKKIHNYEPDGASVSVKDQGMDLHSQRCHVFLLKLT
jgi:hypothetical protein